MLVRLHQQGVVVVIVVVVLVVVVHGGGMVGAQVLVVHQLGNHDPASIILIWREIKSPV